jgi:hypothetical protein
MTAAQIILFITCATVLAPARKCGRLFAPPVRRVIYTPVRRITLAPVRRASRNVPTLPRNTLAKPRRGERSHSRGRKPTESRRQVLLFLSLLSSPKGPTEPPRANRLRAPSLSALRISLAPISPSQKPSQIRYNPRPSHPISARHEYTDNDGRNA